MKYYAQASTATVTFTGESYDSLRDAKAGLADDMRNAPVDATLGGYIFAQPGHGYDGVDWNSVLFVATPAWAARQKAGAR